MLIIDLLLEFVDVYLFLEEFFELVILFFKVMSCWIVFFKMLLGVLDGILYGFLNVWFVLLFWFEVFICVEVNLFE